MLSRHGLQREIKSIEKQYTIERIAEDHAINIERIFVTGADAKLSRDVISQEVCCFNDCSRGNNGYKSVGNCALGDVIHLRENN